ncbi:MAG: arylsulfatase [Segetibacter sp.]
MQYLFMVLLLVITGTCTGQRTTNTANALSKAPQKNLPNIVFILADDMGYGDMQCFNSKSKIPTPVINQLASEGIKFTDAHSAGSWCVPSRYGLMTGQYPLRKTMDVKKGGLIAQNQITIASLLKRNGYHTGMIGKWHLGFEGVSDWDKADFSQPLHGGPADHGFDYFYGMHASLDIPPYFFVENKRVVEAPTNSIAENQSPGATTTISGAFWRGGKIAPGFKHEEVLPTLTKKAVSFIENHVREKKQQPFFLYFALTGPHTPWLAQEQFQGKSKAGEYGDFTMQVDYTVGEVLKTLEKLGIKNNTLVIFTSNNGPVWFKEDIQKFSHQAAGPFRGMKLDAYEGAHRIPFIVRWPGKIKPNSSSSQLLGFTDMLATFAAITGDTLSLAMSNDSYNLLPAFLNKGVAQRKGLIVEAHTVREGDWKLIFGNGTGVLQRQWGKVETEPVQGELYNLKEDPSEANNLFSKYPEKVAGLTKRMEQYKAEGSAGNSAQQSHK